ncbi:hypothetical protein S40293_08885 [Stachybotrys chartarum IBT 40293]|nr:hypothetical protein S40293_08885 [Stachybotrys chartarum IBT 40293]KFA75093.1 hypothetical protein S40288_04017 [Stachybotrys chartarum IBT 40288]
MLVRAVASVALLACAVNASAQPKPYRLAMMPVLGMSLVRRDTSGYQPEQTVCGEGDTCAEACGAGFAECASTNDAVHCFNPEAQQQCCTDGTGNSCDAGYYCTHDTSSQTWCCPDNMSLSECAAIYSVEGGLQTPEPSTSAPATTSAPPTTSSEPSTTEAPTTTITSTFVQSSSLNSTTVAETIETTSSYVPPTSSGFTSAWTGSNSTITSAVPTQPLEPSVTAPAEEPSSSPPSSGATTNGVSALLLLAVGAVAFL